MRLQCGVTRVPAWGRLSVGSGQTWGAHGLTRVTATPSGASWGAAAEAGYLAGSGQTRGAGGAGAHLGHGHTLLLLVSLGSRWPLDPEPFLCAVSSAIRSKRVMQGRRAAALRSQASPGAHPALLRGRRRAPGGPRLPCSSVPPGEITVHCLYHCLLPDHHQLTVSDHRLLACVRPPTTRLCQATDNSPVSGHRLLACVRPLITCLYQATDNSRVSDRR